MPFLCVKPCGIVLCLYAVVCVVSHSPKTLTELQRRQLLQTYTAQSHPVIEAGIFSGFFSVLPALELLSSALAQAILEFEDTN